MKIGRWVSWVLPMVLLAFFASYVVYPLVALAGEAFRETGGQSGIATVLHAITGSSTVEAVTNSVLISILSVIFGAIIGVGLAVTLTQIDFRLRHALAVLAVVPVALPPLVGVVAFMFVFGETGIVPRLLSLVTGAQASVFSLDGIPAIVAVHAYSFNAFFFLFSSAALEQVDGSLVEAAGNLGAGPARVFRQVLLPEIRPALIGASILTFLSSMASFSAPLLFAGSRRFLTLEIFTSKTNGDLALASQQSLLLLIVSLCCFVALNRFGGPTISFRRAKGTSRRVPLGMPRFVKGVLIAVSTIVIGFELLPVAVIILVSFAREGSWTSQLLPAAYSIQNYIHLLGDPSVFQPIGNSLVMSTIGLVGALVVGGFAAYVTTKGVFRGVQRSADVLLSIPYAIPGTVLAIGLILAFNKPTVATGMTILVGTFWILPLAYVLRTYPLVLRSMSASFQQIDDGLIEAATSLGASPWRRFRTLLLPLALPGIVGGAMLTMITLIGEFVASILLYTYSNRPLAVEILAQVRAYSFGQASAYCVVVLLLILAVVGFAEPFRRRVGR